MYYDIIRTVNKRKLSLSCLKVMKQKKLKQALKNLNKAQPQVNFNELTQA